MLWAFVYFCLFVSEVLNPFETATVQHTCDTCMETDERLCLVPKKNYAKKDSPSHQTYDTWVLNVDEIKN
jgi:hypothetical protein